MSMDISINKSDVASFDAVTKKIRAIATEGVSLTGKARGARYNMLLVAMHGAKAGAWKLDDNDKRVATLVAAYFDAQTKAAKTFGVSIEEPSEGTVKQVTSYANTCTRVAFGNCDLAELSKTVEHYRNEYNKRSDVMISSDTALYQTCVEMKAAMEGTGVYKDKAIPNAATQRSGIVMRQMLTKRAQRTFSKAAKAERANNKSRVNPETKLTAIVEQLKIARKAADKSWHEDFDAIIESVTLLIGEFKVAE